MTVDASGAVPADDPTVAVPNDDLTVGVPSDDLTPYCSHRNPFTLSLSKGRERERLRQAQPEGQCEQSCDLTVAVPHNTLPFVVFLGPTLSEREAREMLPGATFMPPVAQGDVYRCLRLRPAAIAIIDGAFDHVPAVWHKEILYALAQGVAVYGAASMGALRAAELDRFGMVGVGAIYQAFRDGVLEDDDEVAIAMAGADAGWLEMSDAMVNIRATTLAAHRAGVIGAATRDQIDRAAKALFYPARDFAAAIDGAATLGATPADLRRFREWLPRGRVNAKRDDAILLLERLRRDLPPTPGDGAVSTARAESGAAAQSHAAPRAFRFAHTVFFDDLATTAPWDASHANGPDGIDRAVLDELRLQPGAWPAAQQGAALRAIADLDAHARGLAVSDASLVDATTCFRREHELHDPRVLDEWMQANALDADGFVDLMKHEARLGWLLRSHADAALGRLADELRATGRWAMLASRARTKARWIEARGLDSAGMRDVGLTEQALFAWYFGERLGRAVPDDIWAFAQASGFDDVEAWRRCVLREYVFLHPSHAATTNNAQARVGAAQAASAAGATSAARTTQAPQASMRPRPALGSALADAAILTVSRREHPPPPVRRGPRERLDLDALARFMKGQREALGDGDFDTVDTATLLAAAITSKASS